MNNNFLRKDILNGISSNGISNINGFCCYISNAGYYFQTGLTKKHLTHLLSYGAPQDCGDSA